MRTLVVLAVLTCAVGCGSSPAPGTRVTYRRAHRAYDGAPPVTPHAVRDLQRQDCLVCHARGLRLDDGSLAPTTPHPQYVNCRQCHVEQVTQADGLAANTFTGREAPPRGSRAYDGAPPTIPHDLDTRKNCLGCHDALGGSPITTPHPDRVNCVQCHVPMRPEIAPWRLNTFAGGSS